MTREAVIVAGSRTAVGKSKRGTTRNWRSDEMMVVVIKDLLRKAQGLDPADIDDVVAPGCPRLFPR
jgi:acetyl-CoA acyltransferase